MTIIVGYKHEGNVYIGGDSLGISGYDTSNRIDEKVFVTHGIAYGFTSSYRMGQILRYHSIKIVHEDRKVDLPAYIVRHLVPMWRKIMEKHGFLYAGGGQEESGSFLVGIDGRLFQIDSDFQVAENRLNYDAIGCGFAYALGYLFSDPDDTPKKVVTKAVKAAIEFSAGCGGKINIVKV